MTDPEEGRPGGGSETPPAITPPGTAAAEASPGAGAAGTPATPPAPEAATVPPPSPPPTPPPPPSPSPPPITPPVPEPTPPPGASPTPEPPATPPAVASAAGTTTDADDYLDTPPRRPRPASRHVDEDVEDDEDYDLEEYDEIDEIDEYDDELAPSRFSGLFVTAGAGIVGLVTLQLLMALLEGLSLATGERFQVPDDLLHRLGYAFTSLGMPTLLFLIAGVALIMLPLAFGEGVSDGQYKLAVMALRTVIVVAVVIALGSVLAVRATLHANTTVPGFFRIQLIGFLLTTLAATALAVLTAVTALKLRDEES